MLTKKLLLTLLAIGTVASITYFGASSALAEGSPQESTIVTHLAEKFNLKKEDVQAVFEAVREERQAEMKKFQEEKLNQAVGDGVITQEQKEALIAKREEMRTSREEHRAEMQKWFTDQGIDETKLRVYMGFGGHRGGFAR